MNQYLSDYNNIIDRLITLDDAIPSIFYEVYRLLIDLRDEINDLRISSSDALIEASLQIAVDKIDRRIYYLYKTYIKSHELDKYIITDELAK